MGSTGDSLKGSNEVKSEGEYFLAMLDDIEKISSENAADVEKLQKKNHNDEGVASMLIKTEPEIRLLMEDMALKEENISKIISGLEKNSNGNEDKQFISVSDEKDLLKGHLNDNRIDKNSLVAALKAETDSAAKKTALKEMVNILVGVKKSESKAWPGELIRNNTEAQLLNRLKTDISILIKDSETTVKGEDVPIKNTEAKAQILDGLKADMAKIIKDSETKIKGADVQIKNTEAKAQILDGLKADMAKIIKDSKMTGKNVDAQIKHALDIKDVEKLAVKDRILTESSVFRASVEQSKVSNNPHLVDNKIKESALINKEFLSKISAGIDKKQEYDLLNKNNTSDKNASQSDAEFINFKEAGLKVKAPISELSDSKMMGMETDGKGNGIILPKNVSGDKSLEEILFAKENRPLSNNLRTGTMNQIVEKAVLSLKNGKSEARVDLKPKFLGSVSMKITTENHLVRVRIITELPVVKEMLENNISQLKTDLQSQGFQIDKLDVSVANDSQQHGKGFEKEDILSENDNGDSFDNKAAVAEETETLNLLKDETKADSGLDFFA